MKFHIEATDPTHPEDLKATLQKARDEWRATTPQEHALGSAEHGELEAATARVDRGRLLNKDQDAGAGLRDAVSLHAEVIKKQSATPGPLLAGALDLIDRGIAAAVVMAGDKPVRVSIKGHFHAKPKASLGMQGNLTRLSVNVEDASLE